MNDDDIQNMIEDIEQEWYDNGFFGEPTQDKSFSYEVARRAYALGQKHALEGTAQDEQE